MKIARIVLALILLVVALAPEVTRYRAERELRRLTSVAMLAASGRLPMPTAGALLSDVSRKLEQLAQSMPGDSRPRIYAGSAALVLQDRERAVALYLDALECGERGETVVNLGRALASMEDSRAEPLFVRAVWVSPGLIDSVPEAYRERVRREIVRRSTSAAVAEPPRLPVLPLQDAVHD